MKNKSVIPYVLLISVLATAGCQKAKELVDGKSSDVNAQSTGASSDPSTTKQPAPTDPSTGNGSPKIFVIAGRAYLGQPDGRLAPDMPAKQASIELVPAPTQTNAACHLDIKTVADNLGGFILQPIPAACEGQQGKLTASLVVGKLLYMASETITMQNNGKPLTVLLNPIATFNGGPQN